MDVSVSACATVSSSTTSRGSSSTLRADLAGCTSSWCTTPAALTSAVFALNLSFKYEEEDQPEQAQTEIFTCSRPLSLPRSNRSLSSSPPLPPSSLSSLLWSSPLYVSNVCTRTDLLF